jgi:hypothetical protein
MYFYDHHNQKLSLIRQVGWHGLKNCKLHKSSPADGAFYIYFHQLQFARDSGKAGPEFLMLSNQIDVQTGEQPPRTDSEAVAYRHMSSIRG